MRPLPWRANIPDPDLVMHTLAFTSLSLLATLTWASSTAAQEERRAVPGNAVAIYNLVGRVTVEAGTGSDVVVLVDRAGKDSRRLSLEVGEVRGRNALRVVYPEDAIVYRDAPTSKWGSWNSTFSVNSDGTWGGDRSWSRSRRVKISSSGSGLEAWANLRIQVPTGKRIDVLLGVGELTARNVSGDIRLEASSARIIASGMRGTLAIEDGSGGIELRDANVDELRLDTGSGGLDVRDVIAKRCKLDTGSGGVTGEALACDEIAVDVGSGSVRLDGVSASRAKIESGSGGVQFHMRTSPRDLSVESGSGGVTISLPAIANAEVDVETGSGSIESDFPVQMRRIERHHLRGTIGDGSGRIRIHTGSGSVHLRKN